MEIQGDRPLDPVARRRQLDAARGGVGPGSSSARPDAVFSAGDSAAVGRLVDILRNANPADVQRIDELKERIADGRYRADPEELAD
ncbi:MAG: flagellar biosynthesis anti-sigma factor FlgM, partial [Planctomycetes bacterium]|nr:flagellar biosynthesis anti-sigma factor FlgM [Planctomycetota bacterium]